MDFLEFRTNPGNLKIQIFFKVLINKLWEEEYLHLT